MLKISELAMPKSHTVTTVCNDRLWSDYEQAKTYFLEMMMITEGEESDRAECVYIQLLHGLDECFSIILSFLEISKVIYIMIVRNPKIKNI